MAFGKCGLHVGLADEVECVAAAVGVEVVAIARAVALEVNDVGGWGGGVGYVARAKKRWECLSGSGGVVRVWEEDSCGDEG